MKAYLKQTSTYDECSKDIEKYLPLVKKIAYHLIMRLPPNVQVDDLIQAGNIGLLEALRNFDESQGASFETYAGIRIRGSMLDEVRSGDWTPRSVHRKLREVTEAMHAIEVRECRDAKDHEVAEELGITLEEYYLILSDASGAKIFSLHNSDDENNQDIEIEDRHAGPMVNTQRTLFKDALSECIETLPEREKLVMSLYYQKELNLREIGNILDISESRVCQIHSESLVRIRSRMREWIDDGVDQMVDN